jgi:hypothetical protein
MVWQPVKPKPGVLPERRPKAIVGEPSGSAVHALLKTHRQIERRVCRLRSAGCAPPNDARCTGECLDKCAKDSFSREAVQSTQGTMRPETQRMPPA